MQIMNLEMSRRSISNTEAIERSKNSADKEEESLVTELNNQEHFTNNVEVETFSCFVLTKDHPFRRCFIRLIRSPYPLKVMLHST